MAHHKKATLKQKSPLLEKPRMPYILLVEDEPTHVAIIRHTIQSVNPNAVVKVAGSLKEYRSVIENSLPEIALIDMHLPDGKALEVLISPPEAGPFPIMVMTSSGDEKIAVKAMKAGALDYVVKSTEVFKAMPHTIERALREWKLIQERKQAEKALRESELRFRSLYENIAIGLYRTTPSGKILLANQALVKMLGYASLEQLAERNLTKAGFAQSSQRKVFLRKIETESEVNDFESTWIRQDGSLVIVQESARAIRDSQGTTLYYDGAVEDITDRRLAEAASRHAEDALRESNEKYHDFYTNAALGIFHSTLDGRFIDMNPALAGLLGYDSPEEAVNSITNIAEQVYTEPSRRNSVATAILKTGGMTSIENNYRRRDGTIWNGMLHLRIVRDQEGKPSHYEGFIEDITERKHTEEALRESEEKFSAIFKAAPGSMILSSLPDGKTLEVNDNFSLVTGYSREEALGKTTGDLNMWKDPYDRDRFLSLLQKNGIVQDYEADMNHKSGAIRRGLISGQTFTVQSKKYLIGTFYDITDRKRAEMELSMTKILLEQTFEQSPVPMVLVSMPNAIVRIINPACREFLGVMDEPSYIGTSLMNYKPSYMDYDVQGNVGDVNELPLARALNGQKTSNEERFIVRKDGTARWELASANPIYNDKGEIIAGYLTMNDVTERKRSEVLLKQSETRYRLLADHMKDTIWLMDMDLKTTYISTSVEKLRGYTLKELQQLTLDQQLTPASFQLAMNAFSEEIQKVMTDPAYFISRTLELEFYRKDGTTYWSENKFSLIRDENRSPESIMGEGREITDRKRAEEALRESNDRLHLALESANSGTWEWNLLTNENVWSDELWKLYGLEPHSCAASYEVWRESIFVEDREKIEKKVQEAVREGKQLNAEWRVVGRDGAVRWLMSRGRPSRDTNGNVVRFNGIVLDITEHKHMEEALRESEEKYRTLVEKANEAISIAQDGVFIFVNQRMSDLLGVSEVDLKGNPFVDFVWPEDRELVMTNFKKRIAGEDISDSYDFRIVGAGGNLKWIYLSAAKILWKGKPATLNLLTDITERKHAEEAIAKVVQEWQTTFDATNDAMWILDKDQRILRANKTSERIFQRTNEELIGKHCWEIVHGTAQPISECPVLRAKNSLHRESMELKIGENWFEVIVDPILDASNRYDGAVHMVSDITERRRAVNALAKEHNLLHTLIEALPDRIFAKDINRKFILNNTAHLKALGVHSQEEALSKTDYDFRSQEYADKYFVSDKQVLETGEPVLGLEERSILSSGEIGWVLSNKIPLRDAQGNIIGLVGNSHDITERKRIEKALQESEIRFRSLYENTTIGLYRTTPDGKILMANPTLVKMLGYTLFQDLAERNLEKDGFEPSYQRKEFLEKIERDGEVNGLESKWIHQDGTTIFVMESARAIRDSHGKTLYYDGTVEDITERKRVEEALRQMQKLEGLGTLAGGIAHDFNNILGIILAYNTSIERSKGDAKKLNLATETITKAVQRGKTLVQQILTFARKTETEFGAVNVNDIVMEIMTMILETFPKVLTYTQNFEKGMPFISADRSQLHQALLNLCVNARDAMPSGGVLTINTHMVSGISLRTQHPDAAVSSYVCIEVSDTGEGMIEETRKRIFEPFFTTKGIGKGTGLGLAVVFGVVQTHKGFIDVESELGKGTIFRLYLPASQVAEPMSEKDEETLEEITGGTETLLVVEDEEMLMMSLRMVLIEKGYNILSAGDGLTALKIYQEKKNDIALVLTDLGLPNMTGLEVCQRIKTIKPNEHMILATGFLDPEMKSEFLKAGIQHFLYKPYDLKKVLKVIREVLDEK